MLLSDQEEDQGGQNSSLRDHTESRDCPTLPDPSAEITLQTLGELCEDTDDDTTSGSGLHSSSLACEAMDTTDLDLLPDENLRTCFQQTLFKFLIQLPWFQNTPCYRAVLHQILVIRLLVDLWHHGPPRCTDVGDLECRLAERRIAEGLQSGRDPKRIPCHQREEEGWQIATKEQIEIKATWCCRSHALPCVTRTLCNFFCNSINSSFS